MTFGSPFDGFSLIGRKKRKYERPVELGCQAMIEVLQWNPVQQRAVSRALLFVYRHKLAQVGSHDHHRELPFCQL